MKNNFEQRQKSDKNEIMYGTERILLVDDESDIIQVEEQILLKLGYDVTSYTNSIMALEDFRHHPDNFDMVITDMAMPILHGEKLCQEIIKVRPDIPILVCTGFSQSLSKDKASSIGIKGFIFKPVIMKEFSSKIREILT